MTNLGTACLIHLFKLWFYLTPFTMFFFFFFNDTATTEIYTLSLHDALPIFVLPLFLISVIAYIDRVNVGYAALTMNADLDRKSTRLNSSHSQISYAVFCLKKKKKQSIYTN